MNVKQKGRKVRDFSLVVSTILAIGMFEAVADNGFVTPARPEVRMSRGSANLNYSALASQLAVEQEEGAASILDSYPDAELEGVALKWESELEGPLTLGQRSVHFERMKMATARLRALERSLSAERGMMDAFDDTAMNRREFLRRRWLSVKLWRLAILLTAGNSSNSRREISPTSFGQPLDR